MANLNRFELHDEGFSFQNRAYQDEDIAHLFYQHTVVRHHTNFSYMGNTDKAQLAIYLHDGSTLRFRASDIFSHGPEKVGGSAEKRSQMNQIYQALAARTFQRRCRFYLGEIENHGYFAVGKWRFTPPDTIASGSKEWRVNATNFSCNGSTIKLRKKWETFADKVKRELFAPDPEIKIDRDPDAIFYLLRDLFNLSLP